MSELDSNTSTAIKYFKNNYLKMIAFILFSIILTGLFTHKYYKDNELYYSTFKIRVNGAVEWGLRDFNLPHLDILYYLENEKIENVRLISKHNKNRVIEIEIPYKSIDQKNNEKVQKLKKLMKIYNENIKNRWQSHADTLENGLKNRIADTTNEISIRTYYSEIEKLISRKEQFFRLLDNNEVYKIIFDGKINIKNAKRQMAKNLVISFMVSIIVIIFSLWIKLFLREIKKNS